MTDNEQVTEQVTLKDKPIGKQGKQDYFAEQCYTNKEMKVLIEKDYIFGAGAKITGAEWVKAAGLTKVRITIKYEDGSEKIFPIRADKDGAETYYNKRSVGFFATRYAKPSESDFASLLFD